MTAKQGVASTRARKAPNFGAKTARQIAAEYRQRQRRERLQRTVSAVTRRVILLELAILLMLSLARP